MTEKRASEAVMAAAARAEARSAGAEPVQMDLLPPTRFDAAIDPVEHGKMADAVRRGQRGRPPNAQNKTTREMLDFVRKTIGDPLLESARVLLHTPETLAVELGCTAAEAFDRLEKIRTDLRPYFYAKQAPVDHDGKPVPGLTVQIGGHSAVQIGPGGQELPPWLRTQDAPTADEKPEQNQRIIDVTPAPSHGRPSHETK